MNHGASLETVPELDTPKKWEQAIRFTDALFAAAFLFELDRLYDVEIDFPEASLDALYEVIRERGSKPDAELPNYPLCEVSGRVQPLYAKAQRIAHGAIKSAILHAEAARNREQNKQTIDNWIEFLGVLSECYEKHKHFSYLEIKRDVSQKNLHLRGDAEKNMDSLGVLFLIALNVIQKWNH